MRKEQRKADQTALYHLVVCGVNVCECFFDPIDRSIVQNELGPSLAEQRDHVALFTRFLSTTPRERVSERGKIVTSLYTTLLFVLE